MSGGHAVGSPECLAVEPSSRSRILRRSSSAAGVPCRCWQAICRVRSPLPWECPTVLVGGRLRRGLHAIAFAQSRRRAELPRSPVIVDARCAATGHLPTITASHPERAASQPRQRRPENSPCRQHGYPVSATSQAPAGAAEHDRRAARPIPAIPNAPGFCRPCRGWTAVNPTADPRFTPWAILSPPLPRLTIAVVTRSLECGGDAGAGRTIAASFGLRYDGRRPERRRRPFGRDGPDELGDARERPVLIGPPIPLADGRPRDRSRSSG